MSLWQPTDFWWIFFVFEGGGNNSDREELRSEKQTKCEGDGGGVRCSWGLLWSHVGSFSLQRLRHDSLSAQNGLRHISMSDLCVCLTLRTDVNSAGARRWSAAAAAAECWHTCRAKKKKHAHIHTRTVTISTGSVRFKAFVFMEGFALAPPPTVFHLTVGRGFLLSHSEDLGLCWSVFMAVFMAVWCYLSEYTWLNAFFHLDHPWKYLRVCVLTLKLTPLTHQLMLYVSQSLA